MLWLALMLACGPSDDAKDAPDGIRTEDLDEDGVLAPEDCADDDASVYPGATDGFGDGIDQDCSGADGVDGDGDGFADEAGGGPDCDDADERIHPGAEEIYYDGIDQPCDGKANDGDQDGDGVKAAEVGGPDCDDLDPQVSTQDNAFEEARPADGEVDVLPEAIIELLLRDADARATLEVVDSGGQAVLGVFENVNRALRFTPDLPWAPFSSYTVTVHSNCSTLHLQFSTSDLGQPVVDPSGLVGRVWQIDIRTGVVTLPPLVGSALTASATGFQVLKATAMDGDVMSLLATYAADGQTEQAMCFPAEPLAVDADLAADPWVTLEPDAVWYLGFPAEPGDSVLTGLMRPDGSAIVHATWSIFTDLRDVYDVFGSGTAQQLCTILSLGGFPCQLCPDGVQACLETRIEELELTPGTFDIVPRSPEDIAADPVCAAP